MSNLFSQKDFLEMLEYRISTVDFKAAKEDILPFINDPREADVWSVGYFKHVMENITSTAEMNLR